MLGHEMRQPTGDIKSNRIQAKRRHGFVAMRLQATDRIKLHIWPQAVQGFVLHLAKVLPS